MGIDLEIELNELGNLPLYPPRRRFIDFVPTFIMSLIRRRFSWPKASPREAWAVKGLMLRVAYQSQLIAKKIEETPKPFFLSEVEKRGELTFPEDPKDWN
jgi:hypothetical protein